MASRDDIIKFVEGTQLKKGVPDFRVGDTVAAHVKIVEEGKARTQVFEGIVIAKKGAGLRSTFTIRKVSFGEGVERTFPLHSPSLEKIAVKKRGEVRRAKLFYLRKKIGKTPGVEEKVDTGVETEGQNAPVREEGVKKEL
ncbi:MAG: 50S ribosomal protein L19 [Candidatus Omnitrophica bacterium]|nr:50S ribosomal protein L19 [Candidatus Omnitrophota bacterium]